MPDQTLTAHLLAHAPSAFKAATQSPFLTQAGNGTLAKTVVEEWLGQDRLYAQAYIRFASLLLANIPLPMRVEAGHVNERLVDALIDAITNVRRELKFFEDVARRYGLKLEVATVQRGVQMYRALFGKVGEEIERGERGVLDGLVLLWGTEKVYLEAWKFAGSKLSPLAEGTQDADGGALRKEFIPNWSSAEFEEFVDSLAGFVDEYWGGEGEILHRTTGWARLQGEEKRKMEGYLEELWGEILKVETAFWPDV